MSDVRQTRLAGIAVGTFFFLDDFWIMRDAHDVARGSGWPFVEIFRLNHDGFLLYRPLTGVGYYYVLRQALRGGREPVSRSPGVALRLQRLPGAGAAVLATTKREPGLLVWMREEVARVQAAQLGGAA